MVMMAKIKSEPEMVNRGPYDLDTLDQMTPDRQNRWWLLRTKGRQEKELARELQERRLAYYLPLIAIRYDKPESAQSPMFAGYMFLYGTVQSRYESLKTNRIVQVVEVVDQVRLHWELVAIDRAIMSGLQLRVFSRLSKGDICEIVGGPLVGQVGRVESVSNDELWVSMWISMFNQSIAVKVPRVQVRTAAEMQQHAVSSKH